MNDGWCIYQHNHIFKYIFTRAQEKLTCITYMSRIGEHNLEFRHLHEEISITKMSTLEIKRTQVTHYYFVELRSNIAQLLE